MSTFRFLVIALMSLALASTARAQHFHVDAGASSTAPGTPLEILNIATLGADAGFVFNMVLRSNDVVAGLYEGGPTFTAAGSDGFNGPPAAPGSQLALEVKAVSGPSGGSWSFWDSPDCEDELLGESITFTLPVGTTNASHRFLLSQNIGLPGEDPFGHCHGRRFTVDQPGLYTVWVQVLDISRNGPGGGPIHAPSPIYPIHFNAGFSIARLNPAGSSVSATFGTRNGSRFHLEGRSAFDETHPWVPIAGPVNGNNRLQTLADTTDVGEPHRFYRLRVTTP